MVCLGQSFNTNSSGIRVCTAMGDESKDAVMQLNKRWLWALHMHY